VIRQTPSTGASYKPGQGREPWARGIRALGLNCFTGSTESDLFTTPESTRARPLATWWQLRCPIGGGNTAATEVEVHTVRHEPPPDWQDDPPRRGRPPAWLVAQRQAARQADGDCA
jgi:hypothetical protein